MRFDFTIILLPLEMSNSLSHWVAEICCATFFWAAFPSESQFRNLRIAHNPQIAPTENGGAYRQLQRHWNKHAASLRRRRRRLIPGSATDGPRRTTRRARKRIHDSGKPKALRDQTLKVFPFAEMCRRKQRSRTHATSRAVVGEHPGRGKMICARDVAKRLRTNKM